MAEQWALITGGASGIGYGFAGRLASMGFNILLVSRRLELLQVKSTELSKQHGVRAGYIQADLSTEAGIEKVIVESETFDIHFWLFVQQLMIRGASLVRKIFSNQ